MRRRGIFFIAMAITLSGCQAVGTSEGQGQQEKTTLESPAASSKAQVSETQGTEEQTPMLQETVPQETKVAEASEGVTEGTVIVGTKAQEKLTEEKLKKLVDENINCNRNIFGASYMTETGSPVQGEFIYQVDEKYFKDYQSFETYIRSVYCKAEADSLLYDTPYEGDPRYINIDGMLCVNLRCAGNRGDYVDWTNYTITVEQSDETQCQFILEASFTEPGENPVAQPYKVEGMAIYENGQWVLTKMLA